MCIRDRLYSQALGQPPLAYRFADADRFAAGLAAGFAAGGGEPVAAGGVAANDDCGVGGDAAGAGFDRADRRVRRECADHRGAWDRERGGGTDFACAFASIEHADGYCERRRVVGGRV